VTHQHRREGLTLIEVLVGLGVMVLVAGLVWSLHSGATFSTARVTEHSDAVRSVLIASERLRADVGRVMLQDLDQDVAVLDDGRGISFLVSARVEGDPWTLDKHVVTYRLKKVPGSPVAHWLVREAGNGAAEPVPACLLEDMQVRVVQDGEQGEERMWIELTLVGVGQPKPSTRYVGSLLVPLAMVETPGGYEVPGADEGPGGES
jgi:type II secretory pathway pseudopilin PulG